MQAEEDSKMNSMLALVRRTTIIPKLKRINSQTYAWEEKYEMTIDLLTKYLSASNKLEVQVTAWQTLSVMANVLQEKLAEYLPKLIKPMKDVPGQGNTEMMTYCLSILKQNLKNIEDVGDICTAA